MEAAPMSTSRENLKSPDYEVKVNKKNISYAKDKWREKVFLWPHRGGRRIWHLADRLGNIHPLLQRIFQARVG